MKLENLISYLINPENLPQLYAEFNVIQDSEAILIYLVDSLDIESEIKLFELETTEDDQIYYQKEIRYIQLFPIDLAIDLIESDLNLKNKGFTNLQIANRLLEYRINDA